MLVKPRRTLDEELGGILADVRRMGDLAQGMVRDAVRALTEGDEELAREVIKRDDEVDALDLEIETRCIRLIALHHPVARDLRKVGTALKVIADIERMGDHAVDIAKKALRIKGLGGEPHIVDIRGMAEKVLSMTEKALKAFVQGSVDLVMEVVREDEVVDEFYRKLFNQLVEHGRRHPERAELVAHLLMVIRFLERVADHATNVVERVAYMQTGNIHLVPRHRPESLAE